MVLTADSYSKQSRIKDLAKSRHISTYIIQIVTKKLHGNKQENNCIGVAKSFNYETNTISAKAVLKDYWILM